MVGEQRVGFLVQYYISLWQLAKWLVNVPAPGLCCWPCACVVGLYTLWTLGVL